MEENKKEKTWAETEFENSQKMPKFLTSGIEKHRKPGCQFFTTSSVMRKLK